MDIRLEKHGIPFPEIRRVAGKLPYGTSVSVMFKTLAVTGCRIKELAVFRKSMMRIDETKPGWVLVYWKCGKNQPGYRAEPLPPALLEEIRFYREHNNVPADRLFGLNPQTFERYFRKFRVRLGGRWLERVALPYEPGNVEYEHYYNLGGLRKSWATLFFSKEYRRWNDAGVALEMTSKRMKHSSEHLTCHHYIRNFEELEIGRYINLDISEILHLDCQTCLSYREDTALHEVPLCVFEE